MSCSSASELIALIALIAVAGEVRAEDPKQVGVHAVVRGARGVTARAVEEEIRGVVRERRGLALISPEEKFVAGERTDELSSCGSDRTCYARELSALGAELGLLVVLNLDSEPPLLAVELIDTASAAVRLREVKLIEDGRILEGLRAVVINLFERTGYERISLALIPPKLPPTAPESSLLESPWFWGSAAVAAVTAVVVTALVLSSGDDGCYCAAGPSAMCPENCP